ncbi:FUSC family protein [Edaphobacter aggregans]|uniref:FUSC family protein n=1 Tax=Edaphobacter aggregans TaxID=570835 RepID=UPI0012F84BE3|nr:FUSC family protein [Edaphobacter aggregans]
MSDIVNLQGNKKSQDAASLSRSGSLWTLLQAELSTYPGRPLLAFRIILSCTLTMFLIMVFRIPGAALGAYYPLLVSRDNLHSTRRSALWIAATCLSGTGEVVFGGMLFAGSPFLHLLWVCGSIVAVFYLISCLKVYEAAVALGLMITNAITVWDQPVSADQRIRQTLFTLLAILMGCAVTILVEYLLAHTHPPDTLLERVEQRLVLVGRILRGYVNRGSDPDWVEAQYAVKRHSERGTGTLRELIEQGGYTFEERQRLSTVVALSGRLVDLVATLTEMGPSLSVQDQELFSAIGKNVMLIRDRLSHRETSEWVDIDDMHVVGVPILIEIERTVALLAQSLSQPIWDGIDTAVAPDLANGQGSRIFIADTFSSKENVKFAIRGGISAIACYFFYMSVGWTGLSSSIATCILTALPTTGAARHKQLMRFAGVVLGACALGFTVQTIILPQIDSILSHTLLFSFVIFLGAWVATSGPRIAFCGAQIVLAYELVNLNRFSINPSLVPARDTVLGIVLGIAAMWLIFDHLWAKASTESLRSLLGRTVRGIADLDIGLEEHAGVAYERILEGKTDAVMRKFERLRSLVDVSIFEAFPKALPDEILLQHTRDYLPQLRAALLLKAGLIHHRLVSGNQCQREVVIEVQKRCSELLHIAAAQVDAESPDLRVPQSNADREIHTRLQSDTELVRKGALEYDITELRLCSSLFSVVHHVTTANP